jgi:hypothetical protein
VAYQILAAASWLTLFVRQALGATGRSLVVARIKRLAGCSRTLTARVRGYKLSATFIRKVARPRP